MIRRLLALFRRYAGTQLAVSAPGFPLTDAFGLVIGNVDLVAIQGDRLRVTGWAQGARVVIRAGAERAAARPVLERRDVAATRGIAPDVGFDLSIPRPVLAPGQAVVLLLYAQGAEEPVIHVVALPAQRLARLALWPGFLARLVVLIPAILGWRLTRDPRHRARIKQLLAPAGRPPVRLADARLLAAPADAPARVPVPGPITIVLPVYNAFDLLAEVLARVIRHTDLPWHLVLIEDCSPDERVRPFLRDWAAAQGEARVTLIENARNLGFIGAVNAGLALALARGHHVVLLNSDAFVPAGWASRLLAPILADPGVASVTPMSNDAEIFSAPVLCRQTMLAPGMADRIDAVASRFAQGPALAEAPTGVGFCMAMNVDFLRRLPTLDPAFGRGYGEEVDWCQRARRLKGRHLGQARLFVEHRGGTSFGSAEKLRLVAQNNALIARRYPSYDGEVQRFIARDPLVTPRLALAVAWAASWAEGAGGDAVVPVYLAHSLGGGAEIYLARRIAADLATQGRPAIVLRVGGPLRWQIEVVAPGGTTAGLTDDAGFLAALLGPLGPRRQIVYSCGVGDGDPVDLPAQLIALGQGAMAAPEVLIHDFFPLSPSYTLLDAAGQYHGPLDLARDGGDPAHMTRRPDGSMVTLAGWQAAWGALIAQAGQITVFSGDSRDQVLAAYPEAAPRIAVLPHALPESVPPVPRPAGPRRVVGVLGNIGLQKGLAVVAELGALWTGPSDPGLVVIGNTDPALPLPAHVRVHGDYRVADIPALVARHGITDWLIPSIWPETFSFTTHEALATGLPVMAFAIGAQGAAVAAAGNGVAVPFGSTGNLARNVVNAMAVGSGPAARQDQ